MQNLLTSLGTIAGIAGLAFGVFLILFKDIIQKIIFPKLTKKQGYRLIITISTMVWSLSICGIVAWVIMTDKVDRRLSTQPYTVDIMPYPTSVNHGAKLRPHSVVLELHCGENIQRLETVNYPASRSFTWTPNDCGDVYLYITIGNIILKKSFLGKYGLPEFLRIFSDGHRIYRPNDFNPDESDVLDNIGIEFLNVHFRFKGDVKSIMQHISD